MKEKKRLRGKSLLTISTLAYDFMSLMIGRNIQEIRELMNQTRQTQMDTINYLLREECIEKIEKGKYKLTKFGRHIMPILKTRRENGCR